MFYDSDVSWNFILNTSFRNFVLLSFYFLLLASAKMTFSAIIEKFGENGDKTGWHYLTLPQEIATQLHPQNRKSFRVKGFLDAVAVSQLTAMPKADGDYLIALKGELRRKLRKGEGATVMLRLEKDEAVFEVPALLTEASKQMPMHCENGTACHPLISDTT